MPFFDELMTATAGERTALLATPILRRAVHGDVARADYLAFLGEAYHHVRHTAPLLAACGARLPAHLRWLRAAVDEYITEETGHEEWILADIRTCGGDAEAVRASTPLPATELMVAYAYDTVQRRQAVGFFGMVLVLEGTSVQLAARAARAIQHRLDLPDQAFRYLTSHGALDQRHIHFFESLMNRIDAAEDRAAVIHCARMFYRLYGAVFTSLSSRSDTQE